jgi:hypothetical protein
MDAPLADEKSWPVTCPECGTELQRGTIDLDPTNRDDPEFQAGEMVAIDFCPNPDCPTNAED